MKTAARRPDDGPTETNAVTKDAKQLDGKSDEAEDITKYLDVSKTHRPEQEQGRVKVDLPIWVIHSLDKEAKRLGVRHESIMKVWVAERLEEMKWA